MRLNNFCKIAAVIFLTLFVAGCTAYPDISADKAILPYVELYATGKSEHIADAGISEKTAQKIYDEIHTTLKNKLSVYPLNDETLEKVADDYIKYLQEVTKVQTSLKKYEIKKPIVEVRAIMIDESGFDYESGDMNQFKKLDGFSELYARLKAVRERDVTDEQIHTYEEFQNFMAKCLNRMLRSMPVNERTLDVKCTRLQGDDAKMYWGPEDFDMLVKFAQGQKI